MSVPWYSVLPDDEEPHHLTLVHLADATSAFVDGVYAAEVSLSHNDREDAA